MFEWLIKEKRECHLCGERAYLKYYSDFSDLINYGKICVKCISFLEKDALSYRQKANAEYSKKKLIAQKNWRNKRDGLEK